MRVSQVLFGVMAFVGLLSFSAPAKADLLLEPYVKYEFGSLSSGNTTYTQTGPGLGLRLGFQQLLIIAALDYSVTNGSMSGGSSPSFSESQLFAIVGVRLPLVRLWAGYGFIDDLDMKFSNDYTLEGSAVKFGASFTGIPIIALNLEYVMNTYTKAKTGGNEASLSSNVTDNEVVVSISAPFSF